MILSRGYIGFKKIPFTSAGLQKNDIMWKASGDNGEYIPSGAKNKIRHIYFSNGNISYL